MAQKLLTILISDIDGATLEDGEGQTVRFGLDGKQYELDLNNEDAGRLRDDLATWVTHARKGKGATRTSSKPVIELIPAAKMHVDEVNKALAREKTQAIRAWAEANGIAVAPRGRISATIVAQYEALNPTA